MTVEEAKLFDNLMRHNSAYYGYELCRGEIKTILQGFEELKKYRAIGTVEELRELKEKATAKKVFQPFGTHSYKCPACWLFVAHNVDDECDLSEMAEYCPFCGQHLDWREGKE